MNQTQFKLPQFQLKFESNDFGVNELSSMRTEIAVSVRSSELCVSDNERLLPAAVEQFSWKWTGSFSRYGSVLFLTAFYKHTRKLDAPKTRQYIFGQQSFDVSKIVVKAKCIGSFLAIDFSRNISIWKRIHRSKSQFIGVKESGE